MTGESEAPEIPLNHIVCERCGCIVALPEVHNTRCLPDPPPEPEH